MLHITSPHGQTVFLLWSKPSVTTPETEIDFSEKTYTYYFIAVITLWGAVHWFWLLSHIFDTSVLSIWPSIKEVMFLVVLVCMSHLYILKDFAWILIKLCRRCRVGSCQQSIKIWLTPTAVFKVDWMIYWWKMDKKPYNLKTMILTSVVVNI